MNNRQILFLEACNYTNAPLGGQLTAASMLIHALGPRLALAGWTDNPSAPIGRWHKRVIEGKEFDFFATSYVAAPQQNRPFIPTRAKCLFQFMRYGHAILSIDIPNILIREPTIMMALPFAPNHNVCFWSPGIEPALSVSRYQWAKRFSPLFDRVLNRRLQRCAKTILAAADTDAIDEWQIRAKGSLDNCYIRTFPTRVNTNLFFPGNRNKARLALSIPPNETVCITTGRFHRAKGWPLILDAFDAFFTRNSNACLIFVGDGSDRPILERTIRQKGLENRVFLAGQQPPEKLAVFLKAADLFVMGSEKEGWSTSLLEAMASGLPIVTTRFSSAKSIVQQGVNGFVIERNPASFAKAMEDALKLKGVVDYSKCEIQKYSMADLETALDAEWQLS